jgi:hypothetical protein
MDRRVSEPNAWTNVSSMREGNGQESDRNGMRVRLTASRDRRVPVHSAQGNWNKLPAPSAVPTGQALPPPRKWRVPH